MWHSIASYLQYRLKAKTKYRIHSPFIFHFITDVLEKPLSNGYIENYLNQYRASLAKNSNTITVTDFGAGSRIFNSNIRKVSAIAKHAGISKRKSKYLLRIINHLKPKRILEVGTSLGISTATMSFANLDAKITTLEGCPETAKIAKEFFKKYKLQNIHCIVGEFSKTLPKVLKNNSFDLIYFDGNHQKEATIAYFNASLQSVHNDTLCIFDDIHWTKDMEEAWEYIKNHPKATVTVDLYNFGIVFYRKEQEAQNFILRV